MKVMVLNPPYVKDFCRAQRWAARTRGRVQRHPDFLAYATAVLEDCGVEAKLVDGAALNLDEKHVRDEIARYKPDILVLDSTTPSIYNDIKYAKIGKEEIGCFTVMVGHHASALSKETLRTGKGAIDVVVRGEYDYTLRDIAKAMAEGLGLEEIRGINWWVGDDIRRNPDRPYIEDLDELPFPAWHHIDPRWYFDGIKLYPFITLISGRGCPHFCTFCTYPQVMQGRRFRFRSPEKVVEEMEYDLKLFPYLKEIMFEDDTFTASKDRCRKICHEIIERDLDISWSINSRADVLDFNLLSLMKKAGCRMMVIGYEFGSQSMLNRVRKGVRIQTMKRFTQLAKKAGIKLHGCFMIGGPGETKETAMQTIKFAKELDCDTVQFSAVTPYPGTELFEWCERNGFIVAKDWTDWLDAGEQSTVISYPNLSSKEIVELVDLGLRSFYFRPKLILRQLITTRSATDFYRKVRGFVHLLSYLKSRRKNS